MQINEEIRDPEVRVIDENGQQLGIMDVRDAQRLADERELDLVKVSFNTPPTCKLMNYSKYRYDMMKREKEQKKNQKTIEIKEIRLSATIDVHDMEVKAKQCEKFLQSGDRFVLLEPYYAGGTTSFKPSAAEVFADWSSRASKKENYLTFTDRNEAKALLTQQAVSGDIIVVMGARDNSLSDYAASFTVSD